MALKSEKEFAHFAGGAHLLLDLLVIDTGIQIGPGSEDEISIPDFANWVSCISTPCAMSSSLC